MKKSVSLVLCFLFSTITTAAWAGALLIETRNGESNALVVEEPMCPIVLENVRPYPQPSEEFYFIEDDISYMAPVDRDGVSWTVRTKTGESFEGIIKGSYQTSENNLWKLAANYPNYMASLVKILPNKTGNCKSYWSFPRFFNRVSSTNINKITFYESIDAAEKEVMARKRANDEIAKKTSARIASFRKKLAPGVDSHCGMVIEVKSPLVKVQTSIGEKFFRAEQIFPPDLRGCRFVNGVYQE